MCAGWRESTGEEKETSVIRSTIKMNLKRSERRECRQYLQEVDWGPGRDAKVSKRLAVGWKVTTTSSKLEGTRRNRVNGAQ